MNLPVPTCADCGVPRFSKKPKKSPYCRRCVGRHTSRLPERRAKASAAMKAHLSDPTVRAHHFARANAGLREAMKDPAFVEKRRELGRRTGLLKRGMSKHPAGSPLRISNGKKSAATKLAWCPPEYRDEYKRLIKRQNIPAAEARRMIEAMIEADARRYHATGVLPQAARIEGAEA
ncbi:hypothetical protein KNJ79_02150 [Sphingopyxis indica]|uniref:hypothetical protein n=1 Tax=Sphingopyxis indica TaxID=436663 RepID=UPI002939171C|nr:hypothetical protein [Sphingopyxis indica]WOF43788.1 hypothetical protein KNJ79_02150 [Sphingopyxis indica]